MVMSDFLGGVAVGILILVGIFLVAVERRAGDQNLCSQNFGTATKEYALCEWERKKK